MCIRRVPSYPLDDQGPANEKGGRRHGGVGRFHGELRFNWARILRKDKVGSVGIREEGLDCEGHCSADLIRFLAK